MLIRLDPWLPFGWAWGLAFSCWGAESAFWILSKIVHLEAFEGSKAVALLVFS